MCSFVDDLQNSVWLYGYQIAIGGEYLLTRTQQVDFHVAFGLNRNSPDYIVGVGYSWRFDNLFAASAR
jgi:hypothetical protein